MFSLIDNRLGVGTDWILREKLGPDLELKLKLCILNMFEETFAVMNTHRAKEVIPTFTSIKCITVSIIVIFHESDEYSF